MAGTFTDSGSASCVRPPMPGVGGLTELPVTVATQAPDAPPNALALAGAALAATALLTGGTAI